MTENTQRPYQAARKEDGDRFRAFVENAVEGIYQTSSDGHYLMANKALARIYGYDSVEAFLPAVQDVANQIYVDPRRRAQLQEKLRSEGVLGDEESQVRRCDGSAIWISESMREVRDEAGTLLYYEGSVTDITLKKEAEESLLREIRAREEAEKRYRQIVENAVEGIYQTTPDGRYLMANKALARIYGYDSIATFLAAVHDIAHDIYVDPERRNLLRDKLSGQGLLEKEESRVRRRDGSAIWICESMREVRDEAGALLYYEGSVTDITLRKEAEATLLHEIDAREEAERRYRHIIENAVEGIYQTTSDGRYLMANKALARIYGHDSVGMFLEAVQDVANQIYVDPARREQLKAKLEKEGLLQDEESLVRRRDDAVIWISESMREVRDEAGKLLHYEGSVSDITLRKEMEASRLRKTKNKEEAEKRFRSIIENAVQGIYQTSPDGHYLMANKALARIYGYDSVGMFLEAVQDVANQVYVDPRRREKLLLILKSEGLLREEESEVRRRDGSVIWISESMREVRDEDDRLLYYEGSVADITQRKAAEVNRQQEISSIFGSYISPAVMDQILNNPEGIKLGGVEKPVSILFSDISDFSDFSETMMRKEQELVRQLNEYFERMVGCILRHDGTLHKYVGDAIMAAWGDVVSRNPKSDAKNAVRAALAMRRELVELNRARVRAGIPPWRVKVGINHGNVVVGNIGATQRREFTVIGNAVNVANRLEGVAKHFGTDLAIGESVRAFLGDEFLLRSLGLIRVKGQTKPIRVYEVFDEASNTDVADSLDWLEIYEEGFNLYAHRRFAEAARRFEKCLETTPGDLCAQEYLRESRVLSNNPPPDDWTGERTLDSK